MGRPTGTWIFWLLYPLPSLAQLLLSQDITIMAMVVMDMEVMVIMATTARGRLSQLLLLKPMLSQGIIIMDTATMDIMARGRQMLSPGIIITVTDTLMVDMAITVIMARGRPRLPLDIIIMDILMAMVAMDTTVTMERGRLMLSPDTTIMDMATMATMARERLSQDIIIMAMVMVDMAITVMDTTVNKQHLFISFQNSVTTIRTRWNLVNRNTNLEKKYKNSLYEI